MLRAFSILWCLATLCQLATFTDRNSMFYITASLLIVSCVLHLVRPNNYRFFIAAVFLSAFLYLRSMPFVANHILLELLFCLTIITGFSWNKLKKYIGKIEPTSLEIVFEQDVFPTMRWLIVIVYFFAIWQKLNVDFFTPDVSYATFLLQKLLANTGLDSINMIQDYTNQHFYGVSMFTVYTTLFFEALIPVLLIIKRIRSIGLLIALLFHGALALTGHHGVISFSVMLLAYFVLFWNKHTTQVFTAFVKNNSLALKVAGGIAGLYIPLMYYFLDTNQYRESLLYLWYPILLVYLFIYLKAMRKNRDTESISLWPKLKVLYLFPIVFFLNCWSPYFGLKTGISLAMFSNLHVDGGESNHFIIPASWQIFDYMSDVVTIIDTDIDGLETEKFGQPTRHMLFEFVRSLNNYMPNGYIRFELHGKEMMVEKRNEKWIRCDLDLHQNFFEKKFLLFQSLIPMEKMGKVKVTN